jgi:arylsulfatase A-like enzyme
MASRARAFSLIAFLLLVPAAARGAARAADVPRSLVIIVVDGCRPEYLRLVPMPRLEELKRRGTTIDRAWVGHLMNNTPPSHATLTTGCFPSRHGIVGFHWKDPESGQRSQPTALGPVTEGRLGQIIRDSNVPSLLERLRAKRRKQLRAYSISSNKYYAAAAMGGRDADVILFAAPAGGSSLSEEAIEEGPGNVGVAPGSVVGHSAPQRILTHPALHRRGYYRPGDVNGWAVTAALKLFDRDPAEVLYLNLPESDEVGHTTGASLDAVGLVIQALDGQIGQIVDAYKRAGRFEETLFVITADHAMIPNRRVAKLPSLRSIQESLPAAERAALGSRLRPGVAVVRPPYLWIRNAEDAAVFADALSRTRSDGIRGVFYKRAIGNGGFDYQPSQSTQRALEPALVEAYRYLLSTMACANGPDIALATEEHTLFSRARQGSRGGHIAMTWEIQHIPMIFSGPGVRAGAVSHAPARLVDVAPTVARLFGADTSDMDGVVVTDVLAAPSAEDEARSRWVFRELAAYQAALEAACRKDLLEASGQVR